jgi:hypothetical protein
LRQEEEPAEAVSVSGISIRPRTPRIIACRTPRPDHSGYHEAALNVTATGVNKVYDGTTAATVTISTIGLDDVFWIATPA